MSHLRWGTVIGMVATALLGASWLAAQEHQHPPGQPTTDAGPTPLYDNLGTLHKTITTRSQEAQQYFDQGLRLTYAFNHDEAIKSFKQALKHDSTCAMCYWGIAYALGPNINAAMDTSAVRPAHDAVQNALKYIRDVSPLERGYIEALAKRYSPNPAAKRPPLDSAWAKAIGLVAYAYPKDDDAAVLYGEALMDLRPWDYWTNGGRPKARSTIEQLQVVEKVVKRNPNHPGACHFYIHAIEASPDAYKALPCAQRLGSLMPGAGHLVHMPTHIYIKLGQWDLAAEHNAHALRADEQFISERHPTGVYPMGYYPHNFHVMWYSLNMLGRSAEAIRAASSIGEKVPIDVVRQVPPLENYTPTLLYTLIRFSRWDDILKQSAPPADLRYATGAWFYARALAYTATGQPQGAAQARDSLVEIAAAMPADRSIGLNRAKPVLEVAVNHLAGEMAAKQGHITTALKFLRAAAAQEDELQYEEPPAWYMPIRQRLGAVLLAAGRAKEAEKAFREDLVQRPQNGWSLHGLAQSLNAQGRAREAQKVMDQFRKAWATADVEPEDLTKAGSAPG
jgi:tetratricopeptide (TPR) repeat protein